MGLTDRPVLLRAFESDLIVRTEGEERIVEGLLAPYDTPRPVSDIQGRYEEVFRPGCWSKTIQERSADRVRLYSNHGHKFGRSPIGAGVMLQDTGAGLWGSFRVSRTTAGDEGLELARDGIFDSFSVGFRDVNTRWSHGRTRAERLECALFEASLTEMPVYDSAKVLSVRDTSDHPYAGPGSEAVDIQTPAASSTGVDSQTRREWALRLHRISKE